MSARVKSVDTAHRAHTCVVEIAHSPEEVLSHTPAFAAIEQNGKAQSDIDLSLLLGVDEPVGEKVLAQSTESCCRFVYLVGNVRVAGQCVVDERSKVLELICEGHKAVCHAEIGLIAAAVRLPRCWEKHGFGFGGNVSNSNVHKESKLA